MANWWDSFTGLGGWLTGSADDTPPPTSMDAEGLIKTGVGIASLAQQGAELFGLTDSGRSQPVGYQGSIPSYTASRMQVPNTYDPARRPGSAGQRYFTDTQFNGGDATEQAAGLAALNLANPARQARPVAAQTLARGGIAKLQEGRAIAGETDGMADEVPAVIEGEQPAALSDGEFVIPADVVSGLGNGNTEAGVKVLEDMMDRVREARTGTEVQAKEINPEEFLPV
jgi:hypothetical protein|tara:strand:+ start:304 stop:984 length:681 start_codon:yes stop_codon:yes gene_type:complete